MKDFSKEIEAYALENVIEFGKTDAGRILPKLFQHGLDKKDIKEVMPLINEIIKKVNKLSDKERKEAFEELKNIVKKHEEKEKDLPDLDIAGKVVTRMAPEPSKYIHLGHAMTFVLNYMYAKRYKGQCVLRFEDTNPEKVSQEYVDATLEDIKNYLGIKLTKIRYVSDDMPKLYKYAEQLVKEGHAYVCFCEREKMQDLRHKGVECQCRQFPVKTQVERWKDFVKGKYTAGEAVMRLKGDMQNQNHVMRDPALFRKLEAKHYRHGTKYKVWPLYDFYNPIEDDLMHVTLILRSNEFEQRVELQDMIKDLLKLKKQKVVQYGRFNVVDFTTKGREIRELVQSGELIGWDDPRLITLKALKRRGIKKEAIYELVKQVGLSKNQVNLEFDMIASINRKIIDKEANRYYFVKDPVKIDIEKKPQGNQIEVPVHPNKDEKRILNILEDIYISKEDFSKLKGKEVRLLHLYNINLNKTSKFTSIEVKNIPKIQWVSDSLRARVLMPDGKWTEGLAERAVEDLKEGDIIQFERFGFCRFDGVKNSTFEFWFSHQ